MLACSEDPRPLAPDVVTDVKAYDLDNNGDASDIRVDFMVGNNLNVSEYRVMVVPAADTSIFDVTLAATLPESTYERVPPESLEVAYSLTRLTGNPLDVRGAAVQNGSVYSVVVLVEGVDEFQLSEFSRPFTLADQGIYAGDYSGTVEVAWSTPPGDPCPASGVYGEQVQISLIALAGQQYQGVLSCVKPGCDTFLISPGLEGTVSFEQSGSTLIDLSLVRNGLCFAASIPQCVICEVNVDPCNTILTGASGTIGNELVLILPLSGENCETEYDVVINLLRR